MATKKPAFETFVGFRPSPEMLAKIDSIVEEYCEEKLEKIVRELLAERLKQIVKECLEEEKAVCEESVVELKRISKEEAVVQIQNYIDKHQGCRTSDIIFDLELDPDLVLSVLEELRDKGKIRGENL